MCLNLKVFLMEPARDAYYHPPHPAVGAYPPMSIPFPPHMPHPYAATAAGHVGQSLNQPMAAAGAPQFPSFGGLGTILPHQISPGLYYLYSICRRLYPNQLNPLQATAVIKYW